jgi:uncharacterized integral membrane protein
MYLLVTEMQHLDPVDIWPVVAVLEIIQVDIHLVIEQVDLVVAALVHQLVVDNLVLITPAEAAVVVLITVLLIMVVAVDLELSLYLTHKYLKSINDVPD